MKSAMSDASVVNEMSMSVGAGQDYVSLDA